MKKFIILLFSLFVFNSMNAQTIGYIDESCGWYKVYDDQGNQLFVINDSEGRLIGYSNNYYILSSGGFYKIYNNKGQRISVFSTDSVGKIIKVNNNSFVSKKSGFICTYDMKGRLISSR